MDFTPFNPGISIDSNRRIGRRIGNVHVVSVDCRINERDRLTLRCLSCWAVSKFWTSIGGLVWNDDRARKLSSVLFDSETCRRRVDCRRAIRLVNDFTLDIGWEETERDAVKAWWDVFKRTGSIESDSDEINWNETSSLVTNIDVSCSDVSIEANEGNFIPSTVCRSLSTKRFFGDANRSTWFSTNERRLKISLIDGVCRAIWKAINTRQSRLRNALGSYFSFALPPMLMRRQATEMPTVERLEAQKYTDSERERKKGKHSFDTD